MDMQFKELLRANQLSLTKQRLLVFHTLIKQSRALKLNELVDLCKSIDRVTIYRIIDQFEKIGVIHKVQIGWKYKIELGDSFKDHHHHLTCLNCGTSIDVDEPEELHDYIDRISRKHTFTITQHTLELRGLCNRCN